MTNKARPRANVYVDGFNFYYGCFKDPGKEHWAPYRWLDLGRFCRLVFPDFEINRIRYFTAHVSATFDDPDKPVRQQTYLRALETIPNLSVHLGRFSLTRKYRILADPNSHTPVPLLPITTVPILQQEEKGSDVNLATYLILDGFAGEYDIAIVVSHDSDLAELICQVRSTLGTRTVLLNPRRRTASDLRGVLDIYRSVRFGAIRSCQFPNALQDDRGTFSRPESWR